MDENIQIIRSKNRRRTVSARMQGDMLIINAPQNISEKNLDEIICKLRAKIDKKKFKNNEDLLKRAQDLNQKYFDGNLKISSIKYSPNQTKKFGCCNLFDGSILISDRLKNSPTWVLDYVILHELSHLIVPNHGKEFKEIISQYNLSERAIGFLMGVGFCE